MTPVAVGRDPRDPRRESSRLPADALDQVVEELLFTYALPAGRPDTGGGPRSRCAEHDHGVIAGLFKELDRNAAARHVAADAPVECPSVTYLEQAYARAERYFKRAAQRRAQMRYLAGIHGGLIVMERNVGLRNFTETGTRIDAKVSAELLVTIFSPGSPLHDGALILREDTVVAASCLLPLSTGPGFTQTLGTRHRAALGLSEETDAAVVVVSEETGSISVAFRGEMKSHLDEGSLRSELVRIFRIRGPEDVFIGVRHADRSQRAHLCSGAGLVHVARAALS